MAYAVIEQMGVMAQNVDIYNSSFINTADLENGSVFVRGAVSTTEGESQVYTVTAPSTGNLSGLWMAYSPVDVIVTDAIGNNFKGLELNPKAFTNVAGLVFGGFKPQVGDRIKVSVDGITGTVAAYAVAVNGANKLAFASAAIDGLSFKVESTDYISIADGTIGSQRTKAYILECVAN